MSQSAHRIYKELVPLEKKYKYMKRNGRGGIREDQYDEMVLKYKYDFLKKKLEYLTQSKYDDWYERIRNSWVSFDEREKLLENKMKNDTELIILNRVVRILKIKLLKTGYNKIYL